MYKGFQYECRRFLVDHMMDCSLLDIEKLLWIYLNIYFNYIPNNSGFICKDEFLKKLSESKDFSHYKPMYFHISQEKYDKLNSLIANNIKDKKANIDLKELEGLFEGLLLDKNRSKTGTYYTPSSIVEIMVAKALEAFIEGCEGESVAKRVMMGENPFTDKEKTKGMLSKLLSIKVIDIACGGGVFLREALNVLSNLIIGLYSSIDIDIDALTIKKTLLEKSIYGVDMQKNTVALCKLLLLMEYKRDGSSSNKEAINLNIFEADGLLLKEINGEPIDNSFDIVIGNPPYIGERGNKQLFNKIKATEFGNRYYEGKMDYFYFFIYKGYELLKENATITFITTNYFVTADGGLKLRCFLKENMSFSWLINFNSLNLFKEAKGQHNIIFQAKKGKNCNRIELINIDNRKIKLHGLAGIVFGDVKEEGVSKTQLPRQEQLYDFHGNILINKDVINDKILDKIAGISNCSLGELCNINQGIVSGADRLNEKWGERLQLENETGRGIFVLNDKEIEEAGLNKQKYNKLLKDFYKNSDIKKYCVLENKKFKILYINDTSVENIQELPELHSHLNVFKDQLIERREVRNNKRKWYSLQWPRDEEIFNGEKIVSPQRAAENSFAYHDGPLYASADVYFISPKSKVSLLYLLGVLNSSLMYFWLFNRGKRKGEQLELYATPLKAIPIVNIDSKETNKIIRLVDEICNNQVNQIMQQVSLMEIDEAVFSLYQLDKREKEAIRKFVSDRRKTND
ncbi:N-6 DNA methylase [Alkaliphilus pronyensis]|uniref:site-specific DNA-methyltransferase (adenine-specific) n=1 Tax=Alkaliphilus pronyensis TaxID=1482732 RepID=A0A6I0FS51_9FIRM|nr:N-6 DNA methylase [Alkaliphilus pronyensis]KAB3539074.1 N-6 DNA methylase [Alkaliphilus pronyensis]